MACGLGFRLYSCSTAACTSSIYYMLLPERHFFQRHSEIQAKQKKDEDIVKWKEPRALLLLHHSQSFMLSGRTLQNRGARAHGHYKGADSADWRSASQPTISARTPPTQSSSLRQNQPTHCSPRRCGSAPSKPVPISTHDGWVQWRGVRSSEFLTTAVNGFRECVGLGLPRTPVASKIPATEHDPVLGTNGPQALPGARPIEE